jgi:hypothetical protein
VAVDHAVDAAALLDDLERAGVRTRETTRLVHVVDRRDAVDERRAVSRHTAKPETGAASRVCKLLEPALAAVAHACADEIVELERRVLVQRPHEVRLVPRDCE